MIIPENTIAAMPHRNDNGNLDDVIIPFAGMKKRDWFSTHAYYCLPLTIGNQYGFGVKTQYNFWAEWNGGRDLEDTVIEFGESENNRQHINSHFGDGIITIQNNWTLRTPPNINLITMDPPNIINHGIRNLTGVIETDNLRRDFTFNLKVTKANEKIFIPKGTIISAFMPIPRFFVEEFSVVNAMDLFDEQVLKEEWDIQEKFSELRTGPDTEKPHQSGRLYYNGEDAYGNKYKNHQRTIGKKK